jgi:hypothetical protein
VTRAVHRSRAHLGRGRARRLPAFFKQQDVQLGDANAKEVTAQYQLADNSFLQDYARRVASRLAATTRARQRAVLNSASPC